MGDNSRIAGGAVVLEEVPPNSTAVGVPARIVRKDGIRVCGEMDQIHVQVPVSQEICVLRRQLELMQEDLKKIKGEENDADL